MGSKKAELTAHIQKLTALGCEIDTSAHAHLRVTYNGVYVGALASTPAATEGWAHSFRKIRHRIELYKSTGRTW